MNNTGIKNIDYFEYLFTNGISYIFYIEGELQANICNKKDIDWDNIIKDQENIKSSKSLYNLGCIYQLKDDYKNMVKYYKLSDLVMKYNNLGYYYLNNSQINKGINLLNVGVKNNNIYSLLNLTYYYFELTDYKKGLTLIKKGIELGYNIFYALLGKYYELEEKNFKLAKSCYNTAINLKEYLGYNFLGEYYLNILNKPSKAKYNFEKCIELSNNPIAKYNMAIYYSNESNKNKCKDYLVESLKLDLNYINNISEEIKFQIILDLKDIQEILKNKIICEYIIFKNLINCIENKNVYAYILENYKSYIKSNIQNKCVNTLISKIRDINIYKKYSNLLNNDNLKILNKLSKLTKIKENCLICFDNDKSIILPCNQNHIVCKNCYLSMEKCPYCRSEI